MLVMLKDKKYFYVMKIVFVMIVLLWNGHIEALATKGEIITSVQLFVMLASTTSVKEYSHHRQVL